MSYDKHDSREHCFHTPDGRKEILLSAERRGARRMLVTKFSSREILEEHRITAADAKRNMTEWTAKGWHQEY